jgi:hypothetical protein
VVKKMSHAQKSARGAGAGGGKAPPKPKKGAAAGKKPEDDREETLQAVVCVLMEMQETSQGCVLMVYRFLQTRSKQDSIPSHWKPQE